MSKITTTNFPQGVTNAAIGSVLQGFGDADPTVFHQYFNDFDTFNAGDWTGTATGAAANAVTAGDGGLLGMVNSAANNDLDSLQLKAASFAFVAGQQAWIKTRFSLSSATNAALTIGLIQTTTTPLVVTDGLYLSKAAASTQLTAKVAKASAISSVNIGAMADATFIVVGIHVNVDEQVAKVYVNGNKVAQLLLTNLPVANLNLTMAVANGTAAANTLTVDYIHVATERPSTQNN